MSLSFTIPFIPVQVKLGDKELTTVNVPVTAELVKFLEASFGTTIGLFKGNAESAALGLSLVNGGTGAASLVHAPAQQNVAGQLMADFQRNAKQPALPYTKPKPKIEYSEGAKGNAKRKRHNQVLKLFAKTPGMTGVQLALDLDVCYDTAVSYIRELKEAGLINDDGTVGPKLNWAELKRRVDAGETLQDIYNREYSNSGILFREFKKRVMYMFKQSERMGVPLSELKDGQAELQIIKA